MRTLNVELKDRTYPIYIGQGILDRSSLFEEHVRSRQVMIVTNETVAPLYLHRLLRVLEDRDVESVVLPDGEGFKNLEMAEMVYEHLLRKRFSRTAHLVALVRRGDLSTRDSFYSGSHDAISAGGLLRWREDSSQSSPRQKHDWGLLSAAMCHSRH